jgi:hypothetical protein
MKYTISAVNQLGLYHQGFIGKVDLIDMALLDYISAWSLNSRSLKRNNKVWINFAHIINEMPVLKLKTKSAISNRIKKLKELSLIETEQDENDQRLYVAVTSRYADIIGFTHEDIDFLTPPTVHSDEQGGVHQNERSSKKTSKKEQKLDVATPKGGVHENEHPVHENEHPVHSDEHPVHKYEHSIDLSLTDQSLTESNNKKEISPEVEDSKKPSSPNDVEVVDNNKVIAVKKYDDINIKKGLDAGISEACLVSFITHRVNIKLPLTQYSFDQSINEAMKGERINMTPEEVLMYCHVTKGWRGVRVSYIEEDLKRKGVRFDNKATKSNSPVKNGFSNNQSVKTAASTDDDINDFFNQFESNGDKPKQQDLLV